MVQLNNGETIGCDLVIFGIGVTPNSEIWKRGNDNVSSFFSRHKSDTLL